MGYNFKKYAQKGNEFIKEVAKELGIPEDKNRAFRILRAVLHTFRDKIPPAESLQLIAQLPIFIKAIYVDGWRISGQHQKMRHEDDFIAAVLEKDGSGSNFGFPNLAAADNAVRKIVQVLKRHVSEGEIADIISALPSDLKPLLT